MAIIKKSGGATMGRQSSRDLDKFVVRMPNGMRERIKARADRAGMSMNEAIVWCLESFFPAPTSIDEKLKDLAQMVAILKEAGPSYKGVDDIYNALKETLEGVGDGSIQAPDGFGNMVNDRLLRFDEEKMEEYREKHESPFDDRNWTSSSWTPSSDVLGDLDDEDGKS